MLPITRGLSRADVEQGHGHRRRRHPDSESFYSAACEQRLSNYSAADVYPAVEAERNSGRQSAFGGGVGKTEIITPENDEA